MNCSVLLVMTLLDSAYFYASGKTLMGSESMIFSCSSNILYWSALLSFARPSKQLLNPFCLFIFYFIFVSAGKDLNPKDIRNRSHILAHTHTHTPQARTYELYFPDPLCLRSCAPCLRRHSQDPSFLREFWCRRGGRKKDKQTSAEIWRGRAHTCTNAQMRAAVALEVAHFSSPSVLLCITHGEERIWQPRKRKEWSWESLAAASRHLVSHISE